MEFSRPIKVKILGQSLLLVVSCLIAVGCSKKSTGAAPGSSTGTTPVATPTPTPTPATVVYTVSMAINGGSTHTNLSGVSLALTSDNSPTEMYVTQASDCASGGVWESFSSTKAWSLTTLNSTNTVYFKVRGSVNESDCVNGSIIHDNIAPADGSLLINSGNTATGSTTVSLDVSTTGATEMYVTNVAACGSGGAWEAYATSRSWVLANADASNTVYVKFRDYAGNQSNCTSDAIVHDSTLPNLTTSSPSSLSYAGTTNVAAFSVSGACGANGQSVVISGSVSSSVTCASSAWSSVLNVSGLTDGTFSINVNHSNLAGNAAPQVSRSFIKDTLAPTGISLTINSGNSYTRSTAGTLSLAATGAADMYITNTAGCGSGGVWETFSSTKAWTLGQTNSTASVYGKFRDAAGNITSCNSDTIIHDNVAPTVAVTSPAVDTWVYSANEAAFSISGTCNFNGGTVSISAAGLSTANCSGGAWSKSLNLTSAGQGSLIIAISLADLAGNVGTTGINVIKDTIAPSGTITLNGGSLATSSQDLSVGISTADGINVYLTEDSSCASGGSYTSITSPVSWVTAQDEGPVYLFAKLQDTAGNESSCLQSTIIYDVSAPVWPDIPFHANRSNSTTSSPLVFYTESAVDEFSGVVSYEYAIGTSKSGANQTNIKNWTSATGGLFTATGLSLSNGLTYYVNMRVLDNAGNFTVVSSAGWMVDNVPPSISITSPVTPLLTSELDIKIVGSCESPYAVTLGYSSNVSGDTSVSCTSNTFIAYSSFTGISGTRQITVTQDDGIGNVASGTLDINYRKPVEVSGSILATVNLPDGSQVHGGSFSAVVSQRDNKLIRLNTNGSKDSSFDVGSGFNGQILAVVELADGSIILGGDFTTYRARPALRIAKLSSTGILDTTFNPLLGSNGFNSTVRALVISGGNIFVGGDFTSYKGSVANYVAKLSASGSLDTSFSPSSGANGANGRLRALASDGTSIFIGGDFTTYRGGAANRVAKLDSNGILDTGFSPSSGANGVNALVRALATDGTSLFVGGDFSSYQGSVANRVAKLSLAGALDTTFNPISGNNGITSSSTYVYGLASAGNYVYLAGSFTKYRGTNANRVAKVLTTNGSLDLTYNPSSGNNGANSTLNAVATNGTDVYLGGYQTTYKGTAALRISKTNLSGAADTTFSPTSGVNGFGNYVNAIYIGTSGKVYVGGAFTSYRGDYVANNIAKITSAGTLDLSFSPQSGANGANNAVRALYYESGNIYLGGDFTSVLGNTVNRIAKLSSAGAFQSSFQLNGSAGPNSVVRAISSDGVGSIFIGGDFTSYSSQTVGRIVAVQATNGSIASGFSTGVGSGANNSVRALAYSSNSLFIGGLFTLYSGVGVAYMAKTDPFGTLDWVYSNPGGLNSYVYALQADASNVYVGGNFTTYKSSPANRIMKVNYSGDLDTTFSPTSGSNGVNGAVNALLLIGSDLYAGGVFSTYRSAVANRVVKVNASSGLASTTFSPLTGGNGVSGSSPSVSCLSSDASYIYIGGAFSTYRNNPANNSVKVNLNTGAQP